MFLIKLLRSQAVARSQARVLAATVVEVGGGSAGVESINLRAPVLHHRKGVAGRGTVATVALTAWSRDSDSTMSFRAVALNWF